MIIDFNVMEEAVLPSFKGGEKAYNVKMFQDGGNRIMKGRLEPGASIGMHTHETDCEVFFILSGKGTVLLSQGSEPVCAGQAHYCPKGAAHSLVNTGSEDLIFYAVVAAQ